jgi:O-antigen ligase
MAAMDGAAASELTTGRFDLWVAALGQFSERPIFGSGASASLDSIATYLPGYYRWGGDALLESAGSGGFHNAYLALLTQRGLVGFLAGASLLSFLLRWAFQLGSRRTEFGERDALAAGIAPYVVVGIALRGLGEQPGFFGAANGLVDFLAFVAAAQVVALAAASRRLGAVD